MATRTKATSRRSKKTVKKTGGGGSLEDQIKRLTDEVGEDGVEQAEQLIDETDPGVIKLAFKLLRQREQAVGPGGLGSRITGLLEHVDPEQVELVKNALLKAKAKSK